MAERERSTEEIRQDIAEKEENFTQTVEEINARLKEKLDWRAYTKNSPYLALGAAAGLGYLASRVLQPRPTRLERFMDSFTEDIHGALGGQHSRRLGLIEATLVGVATNVAVRWLRKATTSVETRPSDERLAKTG
jgi:hypothetical protein